jgi:hypothetical protein
MKGKTGVPVFTSLFPELQNTKNYPIFWDGKGNGKLNSAKF